MTSSISVVIPVKNRPDVIHRALDSVAKQTLPVHEVIIVDDGSTDDTPEQAARRSGEFPSLQVIRLKESVGAASARNIGARAASGEMIALLDSDDAWMPEKMEQQEALLRRNPGAPICFTGTVVRFRKRKANVVIPPPVITQRDFFRRNMAGGCTLAMIRRDAFFEVGGFRDGMPSCQDWEFWIRLAGLGETVCCQAGLSEYFFDGAARITKNLQRALEGHQIVFESIYTRADPAELPAIKAEHNKRLSELFSTHHFRPVPATRCALSAIWHDPKPRRVVDLARTLGRLTVYHLN
ncbi:MAG: glycosyltransferase family A protein [Pseudomonadota bacterium]